MSQVSLHEILVQHNESPLCKRIKPTTEAL